MKLKKVILVLVISLLTVGCSFFKMIDSKEFGEHFEALGYKIDNSAEALYDAKTYLVATKEDVPYKIEYYEFENDVDAKKVYKNYYDRIADYITSTSKNQEQSGNLMNKTVAVSEKEYIVISRVRESLIFIAGTNDYANEINDLLTDIGY